MNGLLRGLFAADSILPLLLVYCAKSKLWLPCCGRWPVLLIGVLMLVLAHLCCIASEHLPKDSIEGGITEIKLANDSYMPVYLGFFFVALSIPDRDYITLVVVTTVLLVFLVFSQNLFYNPLLLLFKYNFYHIKCGDTSILLISKRRLKKAEGVAFQSLRRINDYTFLDMGEKNEPSDSKS